jgi:hypothetical protein
MKKVLLIVAFIAGNFTGANADEFIIPEGVKYIDGYAIGLLL